MAGGVGPYRTADPSRLAATRLPLQPIASSPSANHTIALAAPSTLGGGSRFSTEGFTLGGLAYDAVSSRFLVGDRLGRKLMVVAEGTNHAVDFVRAASAGFRDIAAIEIDDRRGDLWVVSAAPADGGGTLHKLHLVSGRPLKSFPMAAGLEPVTLVDLDVTPTGAVLVLDAAGAQVLTLRPGGTAVEHVMKVDGAGPASLAAGGDAGIAYVARSRRRVANRPASANRHEGDRPGIGLAGASRADPVAPSCAVRDTRRT